MNHFLDSKAIAIGFAISLITVVVSLTLTPFIFPENDTSVNLHDWDIATPENIALSMENALPDLIYASVLTGKVTQEFIKNEQQWSFDLEPLFLSRIAKIYYTPNLSDSLIGTIFSPNDAVFRMSSWTLEYLDCCPYIEKSMIIDSPKGFKLNLQNGLNADLLKFDDFTNITMEHDEQREIAEMQNNVFYWEITHLYNDGTRIKIRAYGNTIIINQIPTVEILYESDGYSFKTDPEKITFPSYYTVSLDNPFENYENVINDALNTIIDHNG